jgi:hypothetical protein
LPLVPHPEKTGYTNINFGVPVGEGHNEQGFDYSFILPASLDMQPYVFIRNGEIVDPHIVLTTDVYRTRQDKTEYAWDKKVRGRE